MNAGAGYPAELWTIPVYVGIVLLLTGLIVFLSAFIGERHKKNDSELPFESGITSTGSARIRFNVQFYIVAMLFLVFDVETIFIITWAVAAGRVGWPGYFEVAVFILLLLAALFYLIRVGAIDWRKRLSRRTAYKAYAGRMESEAGRMESEAGRMESEAGRMESETGRIDSGPTSGDRGEETNR